jgi:hypothetical protein
MSTPNGVALEFIGKKTEQTPNFPTEEGNRREKRPSSKF